MDCSAYLVDNVLGATYDLAVGGYTFYSETGTFDNRFTINLSIDYQKGDVNGDSEITAQDASLVLQLVAGKLNPTSEGIVYEAADVNGDGAVTDQDALLILQMVAGK